MNDGRADALRRLRHSYTKVGLRDDVNGPARLIIHEDNTEDEAGYCFPSAVLVDDRGPARRYRFGAETGRTATAPGIDIERNWKPRLFAGLDAARGSRPRPGGLEALFGSPEFRDLLRLYNVPSGEATALTGLYRSAADLFGRRPAEPAPDQAVGTLPAPGDADVDLAVAFFRDLRAKVLDAAARVLRGAAAPDRVPARVCVPAFADDGTDPPAAVRDLFLSVLGRAGWVLDDGLPVVTEPMANVIGVISEGVNATWRPYPHRPGEEHIHLGKMFRHGPLVTAYRAGRSEYSVLVCDVGSYTTDLALVRFATADDPDRRPEVTQHSVPLGIAALDGRVRGVLPADQAAWWDGATGRRRELCKRALYVDCKAYATAEVGDVGGPAVRPAVDASLVRFGADLGEVVTAFCDRHAVGRVSEVVLTGGGNHVPAVRNGLLGAVAGRFGTGYLVRVPPGTPTRSRKALLTPEQVRAGSALGGCSVYFDRDYH